MRVLFQCHALGGLAVPSTLSTANFFNCHNLSRAKGQIIKAGGIEVYKENKLLVYADFYDLLFPQVKWLFIERNFDDVYQSQFGGNISKEEFKRVYDNQLAKWHNSTPSKKALYVNYGEFKKSPVELAQKISSYLEISPSEEQLQNAISFFKPSK